MPRTSKYGSRLVGLVLLAASGATTLVHRAVYGSGHQGPAQLSEMVVGLATLMLASTGILLLIHGKQLFSRDLSFRGARDPMAARPTCEQFDTKQGVAAVQARLALAAAATACRGNRPVSRAVPQNHMRQDEEMRRNERGTMAPLCTFPESISHHYGERRKFSGRARDARP